MLSELDDVETLEASSLEEARDLIQAEDLDLLLVDIRLSDQPTDRGGLELLRWVKEQKSRCFWFSLATRNLEKA